MRGWAFKAELMIEAAEFTRKWRRGGAVEGAEQQVYPEGGRYFKRTDAFLHATWLEYIHRIGLHNIFDPIPVMARAVDFERGGMLHGEPRRRTQ